MKRFTIPALIIGSLVAVVLIASSGIREVSQAVASAGWGALLVVLVRAATVAGAGVGWHLLLPADLRPPLAATMLVRSVREAVNTLLPFTQVGGDVVGARLLTFYRVGGALAAASVLVDLMVQAVTQFVFTLAGLLALVALGGDNATVRAVAVGLVLAVPALAGFYLVQRRWGRLGLQWLLTRFAGDRQWRTLGAVDTFYDWLRTVYANRRALALSAAVHLTVWFVGALEVFVALSAMGYPVTYAEALVVESLAQAVRGAAFVVPGALGVQEGGLIALCAIFGIPAQPALALSLLKRLADLAVGAPAFLVWQRLESRRLRDREMAP